MSERDYDNEEQQGGRPGSPVDPLRLWNALRKKWQLILIAGVVGAFIGAAIAKKVVKSNYAASGIITWNKPRNDSEQKTPEERAAVVESMLIGSNLEEIKRRMKLEMPAGVLGRVITVAPSQTSNNIAVEATWGSAEGAAELVNTAIDVFLEFRQKVIADRLKQEADRYRGAVAEAERRQAVAAKALDEFRRQSGISDLDQEREDKIQRLAELSAVLYTATATVERLMREIEAAGKGAPAPGPSSADDTGQTEDDRRQSEVDAKRLSEARSELDRAKIQYSADHPNVRRLEAEVTALEARVRTRTNDPLKRRQRLEGELSKAKERQRAAEQAVNQYRSQLGVIGSLEGQSAQLQGEVKVAEQALEAAKLLLAQAELEAQKPPYEFRVIERATPPSEPLASPRKNIAIGVPLGFVIASTLLILLWSIRKLDVKTPKEAAFWSGVPVVGASTWPRDPDMLSSLMHDLDDFAPHCEGVTLIVGASLDEAHLARRVAEWDGHRMVKSVDDPQRMLPSGGSEYPLARAGDVQREREPGMSGAPPGNMQILTLTGPVPAQALRRAARLADRVLVVVASGKHSVFQMMKIQARLGRESGIGVLLVGLDKEFAMVRDRVGDVERFWRAIRAA